MKLARTNRVHSGWGLDIRWTDHKGAHVLWSVYGCQRVGPWSTIRLEFWRSSVPERLIVFRSPSEVYDSRAGLHPGYLPVPWSLPREFWAVCREARKTKVPEVVVDYLHDFGPRCLVRLLEEGIPDGDEVFPIE